MLTDEQIRSAVGVEKERRRFEEEAEELSQDFTKFARSAWSVLKPAEPYHHNWHIDAIGEHLMAVSQGDVLKLQIWVPRATMKSMNVSIFWPAWEWTREPWLRFWTASSSKRRRSFSTPTAERICSSVSINPEGVP